MQDARWLQLTSYLVDRGWTWREDTLVAPHETMWFAARTPHPDLVGLRDRMTAAVQATSPYVASSVEQAHLHEDLVSLVEALDDVLAN